MTLPSCREVRHLRRSDGRAHLHRHPAWTAKSVVPTMTHVTRYGIGCSSPMLVVFSAEIARKSSTVGA